MEEREKKQNQGNKLAIPDKEPEKANNEIIPTPQPDLISIDEAVAKAEQQVGALKKVKTISLKLTNYQDWIDQEGVPYLTDGGAEKLKPVWGISLHVDEPKKEWLEDDLGRYYAYTAIGYTHSKILNISVTDIGTCSQRDKFFAYIKGNWKLPSEIDEMNIKKAAYTNCCVRLIARLLGLKGTTYEDLKSVGVDVSKIQKIEYGKGKQKISKIASEKDKEIQKKLWDLLIEFKAGDEEEARNLLKQTSSFVSKEGKEVEGKTDVKYLTGKWLNFTYGKIKELVKQQNERLPGED